MEPARNRFPTTDQTVIAMERKPSILIVDDEQSVLFTLQLLLQDAGYLVETANSEAEGLSVLSKSPNFDVVITDMSMEHDQSGLEIVKAAAHLRPRPVIIAFTGFGVVENVKGAMGDADYFAIKPIDVDEFKSVLARLLALRYDRLAANRGT
jgi:DNA-binding NtrC family response regulator